ncbi:hypothetical protein [Nonlabens sp. Asnod2-A12]|uniref:hypothetical protein n=1 Tax=Nonlabens sp. Asnod2-A12 TaxID=3160578 RepID=UPI0038654B8A
MKRLLLCFSIIAFTFSCTESDNSENQINQPDVNFFALTIGNSWVYKNYKYNAGTEMYDDTGVIDSISIVGIQDFSGESYYKFRRLTTGNEEGITFCNPNGEHFEFLREFEGSLINEEGSIIFTNSNNEERLLQENEWGNIYEILVEGNTIISVEAGEFDCINSERYAKNSDGEQLPGLDRFYYASGIGLIYDSSSFVSNSTPSIIRRLDSYEVQ